MSDRLKYERYTWFHGRAKSGKYPNARHLAEEFELSPRTAQRDIEFMRDRLYAPLKFDYAKRGYCYTDNSFEIPGHWLNETNILALSMAARLASTIPDPALKDELCSLISRVSLAAANTRQPCFEHVSDKISVKNIEYSRVDPWIFRETAKSLFSDSSLSITYYSPHSGKESSRIVHPLHLMHYMGSWHLLAWCSSCEATRDFALSRIRQIETCSRKIDLPRDLPSTKEYTRTHYGIMLGDETEQVVLRFSTRTAPWIAEQIWHTEQESHTEPDGSLLLSFPVANFRELVRKILSHGADVQVVSPAELHNLVVHEIKKMAEKILL